ncbi:hypothetical protein WJX75_004687 [Coccomyxa subellipsoidea]|uniref:NAD(P)-binding protein n=1 Tax=Coccomyxa subellipsoidea TaxID=248742 RepID=A0ABR2YHQ1_9CHLO
MTVADKDLVYVVTGASRGLGLEFVTQLLHKGHLVVAAARNPKKSSGLESLASKYGSALTLVTLDVSDADSIKAAAQSISEAHPNGIDVLINNAGILGSFVRSSEHDAGELKDILITNVVGPLLVTQHLLPLIRKGTKKQIVNISSTMGSVSGALKYLKEGLNPMSKMQLGYRASKSALNMETAALALDLHDEGITIISICPGWVATDMGSSSAAAMKIAGPGLDAPTSIAGMLKVVEGLTLEQTGTFYNYQGNVVPY